MVVSKSILSSIVGAALMVSASAAAADPATDAAYRLLDSVGMAEAMQGSMDNMLEVQLRQNPAMAPYRKVMSEFFREYVSFESMKDEFAALYIEVFTPEEMEEMADFYESPLGKKSIRLMPELMARGAEIGSRRVQENQAILAEMIRAESERLQQLSEE